MNQSETQETDRLLAESLSLYWREIEKDGSPILNFNPPEPIEGLWRQLAEEVWPITQAEIGDFCKFQVEEIGKGESEEDCQAFVAGQKLIARVLEIAEGGSAEARVALLFGRMYWRQEDKPGDPAMEAASRLFGSSIVANFLAWFDGNAAAKDQPLRAVPAYCIPTSQEFDAIERAASDGRSGRNYTTDDQAGARIHQVNGLSHYVRIMQMPEEITGGIGMDALERLTGAQDADCIFALLYVSGALIPESGVPGGYAGGWVTLDDIMEKIGWVPRSTKEREELRGRIWHYLLFGARAHVIGQRSTVYKDADGKEIPTRIETPLWSFMSKEKPIQPNLFPDQEIPVRVEIVISKQWENLMIHPKTAQFLPMGELLGAIPGSKPGGAWARTVGLSLAGFWRRNPRETLAGTRHPTRSELLTRFQPKKAAPEEVLTGNTPYRALEYWHSALQELAARGFLTRTGEAARTLAEMKESLPRYHWQEEWLKGSVELMPGPKMAEHVKRCADSLPVIVPKGLDGPRRRGRPRKNPAAN